MKNLFITGVIIALSSCSTTSDHAIIPLTDTSEYNNVDTAEVINTTVDTSNKVCCDVGKDTVQ